MTMKACNDHLMRGVVLAPGWARDLRDLARTEYGRCSSGWLLSQVAPSPAAAPRWPGLRGVLRRFRPPAKAGTGADPLEA